MASTSPLVEGVVAGTVLEGDASSCALQLNRKAPILLGLNRFIDKDNTQVGTRWCNDLQRGCAVTIGSFDGVHLGHEMLIQQLKAIADNQNLASVLVTFYPHPSEYFAGDLAPARLMSWRERVEALRDRGIDWVVTLPFNRCLRSMNAETFLTEILVAGLSAKHLVLGDDFRFGCDRAGDDKFLRQRAEQYGFQVTSSDTLLDAGERISSTRIRQLLAADDLTTAARLLGYPYRITGKVIRGHQLGRTIGVPTANVLLKRHRAALNGVFVVKATLANGDSYMGVANIGCRPAVNALSKPLLEVHLFEYSGDLYGTRLTTEFCYKLRDEQNFLDWDTLTKQIKQDIADAHEWIAQQHKH